MINESKLIPENICPECYRELPNHGPDCSLEKNENYTQSAHDKNKGGSEEHGEITDDIDSRLKTPDESIIPPEDKFEMELSIEAREKKEKIAQMKEKVKKFFEINKGELMRIEFLFDMTIDEQELTFSELYRLFPTNQIIKLSIDGTKQLREKFHADTMQMQPKFITSEERILTDLDSLYSTVIPIHEINLIEQSYDEMFETIKHKNEEIEKQVMSEKEVTIRVQAFIDKIKNI